MKSNQTNVREKVVVLTGSGISAESGLQTFRDHGGLWAGQKVEDVATPEAFKRDPQKVLDFYNQLRKQMLAARPNEAHKALVRLEEFYQVDVITQNVDDLHERAGSSHVVHLHGELLKARSSVNEQVIVDCFSDQTLEDVDADGFLMRPYIVWFGEPVPLFDEAIRLTQQANKVIVIGTSLQVYPAASLLHYAAADATITVVDPNPPQGLNNIEVICAPAQVGVASLVNSLIESKNDK